MTRPKLTRGFRSFLQAYQPKQGFVITKYYNDTIEAEGAQIHFIALEQISKVLKLISLESATKRTKEDQQWHDEMPKGDEF